MPRDRALTVQAPASSTTATEPYLFRERQYRNARYGLLIVSIGMIWTFIRWPDARRREVACTVIAHRPSMFGKRGQDAEVEVHVEGKDAWFTLISRSASTEDEDAAFAEWPIGATKNCWQLPYLSEEDAVTPNGASWLPSLLVMLVGGAIFGRALYRARAKRSRAHDVKLGNPYRDAGEREQIPPPPPTTFSAPASLAPARKKAWIAFAFWSLLFGTPVVLCMTSPSPGGSIFEPGSMARLGMFMFPLIALGLPGGAIFWPAFYALLARKRVTLDALGGVVGTSEGLPFLAATQWVDLPSDATLEGGNLIHRNDGLSVLVVPHFVSSDPQAIVRWLDDWRAYIADKPESITSD